MARKICHVPKFQIEGVLKMKEHMSSAQYMWDYKKKLIYFWLFEV